MSITNQFCKIMQKQHLLARPRELSALGSWKKQSKNKKSLGPKRILLLQASITHLTLICVWVQKNLKPELRKKKLLQILLKSRLPKLPEHKFCFSKSSSKNLIKDCTKVAVTAHNKRARIHIWRTSPEIFRDENSWILLHTWPARKGPFAPHFPVVRAFCCWP